LATFGPLRVPLDGGEKVPVGHVQVRESLLEHHRRDLVQPRPLRCLLDRRQPGRQLRVGDIGQPVVVRLFPGAQAVVVDNSSAPERLAEGNPVPWLRI
jgi:hypothetical protein